MKKIILTITLFVLFVNQGFSQNDSLRLNSIFLELGGSGPHYSINYNRKIYFNKSIGMTLGIGFSPSLFDFKFSPRIPIQSHLFYQFKNHSLLCGVSVTPYMWPQNNASLTENLKITRIGIFGQFGYNYTFPNQKLFIGISYIPYYYESGAFQIITWGGLKFGYKF